jgi:hypothetical protein
MTILKCFSYFWALLYRNDVSYYAVHIVCPPSACLVTHKYILIPVWQTVNSTRQQSDLQLIRTTRSLVTEHDSCVSLVEVNTFPRIEHRKGQTIRSNNDVIINETWHKIYGRVQHYFQFSLCVKSDVSVSWRGEQFGGEVRSCLDLWWPSDGLVHSLREDQSWNWLITIVSSRLIWVLKLIKFSVKFEVFTTVTMRNGIFWDVTPFGSCKNRRFGRT